MGEVVSLVPRQPYFPHPLAMCCHYPVLKCHSASIAVTGTLRVKMLDMCEILKWLICQMSEQGQNAMGPAFEFFYVPYVLAYNPSL